MADNKAANARPSAQGDSPLDPATGGQANLTQTVKLADTIDALVKIVNRGHEIKLALLSSYNGHGHDMPATHEARLERLQALEDIVYMQNQIETTFSVLALHLLVIWALSAALALTLCIVWALSTAGA